MRIQLSCFRGRALAAGLLLAGLASAAVPTPPPKSGTPAAKPSAARTPRSKSGTPPAGPSAAPTPPPKSGTPAAKPSAAPTAKPRSGKATPAGTPHAKLLKDSVHSQDVIGGLKKPAVDCGRGNEYLTKALEMNKKGLFD